MSKLEGIIGTSGSKRGRKFGPVRKAIEEALDANTKTQSEIAEEFGVTRQWVSTVAIAKAKRET